MFKRFEEPKKPRGKFQKHLNTLFWKAYVQRLLRWRVLAMQCLFALILCVLSVLIARPVFLTTLDAEGVIPKDFEEIRWSLSSDTTVGYAPDKEPYTSIMKRAAQLLRTKMLKASNEFNLNQLLYDHHAKGKKVIEKVTWVLWQPAVGNVYKFSIRSTEVGQLLTKNVVVDTSNPDAHEFHGNAHFQSGFLAVEVSVCHALLEHTATNKTLVQYHLYLVTMPVTPMMEEKKVQRAVSLILMCYTLAMLPPVLEAEALVVIETQNRFKRALRVRGVSYSAMYLGWLAFAYMTAIPICFICSFTLILIFRWIHLMYALIMLLAYFTVMMMIAFIMSMNHDRAPIACTWTILQTLLQTFLAELIVHHRNFDEKSGIVTFMFKAVLPPLGLLIGFNHFALLRTGHQLFDINSMRWTIVSWVVLIIIYFNLLMLLQRTVGSARAIGGQVSWKSIIFKKADNRDLLRPITKPSTASSRRLQEVDELAAKAISFNNVSKSIMGQPLLHKVTFDIYRGEFSLLFTERIQINTMICVEDLLTGLTYADSGTINVLGVHLDSSRNLLTEHMMLGYCDRSAILNEDLTVEQHFYFYTEISLWHETSEKVFEFSVLRHGALRDECDLHEVYHQRVGTLGNYYRGQLCWAIAILLEPRLVILPDYVEHPIFRAVIRDKIMRYKSFMTIVSLTASSLELQFADRLFLIDNKLLAFGGTPAYMFYKYGRDYRIRVTFKSSDREDEEASELIEKVHEFGATIRARLGTLLILRMPTNPSNLVAQLIEHFEKNREEYGVQTVHVSLPDPEEVFRRAIHESREMSLKEPEHKRVRIQNALNLLAKKQEWKLKRTWWCNFMHLKITAWKYFACYIHYRFFLIITVLSAIVAGASIGWSLATMLQALENDKMEGVEVLTVEAANAKTTLLMRMDGTDIAKEVATAYVWSHTGADILSVQKMSYMSISESDSMLEFLAQRAIDSPQQYVHFFAYGFDIVGSMEWILNVPKLYLQALYSPLHSDRRASARSLARVYMAMMRYYTGKMNASIEITDNPLIMDFTPFIKDASEPTLLIQFLLVLTISHITLVPSKEYGLVRHTQIHASNFSPLRYWATLTVCDVIHNWLLVLIITIVSLSILMFVLIQSHFQYADLVAVPLMLMVYVVGCVPQAYLFSLGPRALLNTMLLIITNIVFGEATLVAKLFYGDAYNYALSFMALSPQFNMAYALVKIRQTFLYNSECIIYMKENLCETKVFHKCCSKCGVLQECYKRKSYLDNIMTEMAATLVTALMMFVILLLWEYRYIQRVCYYLGRFLFQVRHLPNEDITTGALRERNNAVEKRREIIAARRGEEPVDNPFGENLLLVRVSRIAHHNYVIREVYLGLAKGEALALAGVKRHGRQILCEMIAGYKCRNEGEMWVVSNFRQKCSPHKYARYVALFGEREALPGWMTVYDGLEMIGILRGVPQKHLGSVIETHLNALDLHKQQDLQICHLEANERRRLRFAATVIGAPPVLVFDECTAYQSPMIQWAMYFIINMLRKRGHSIIHSAYSMEAHMPVSNRIGIIRDGMLVDMDYMTSLQDRYGNPGYTVVVHLKDEVDIEEMFERYFNTYYINDTSDVLVNIQILDSLTWAAIFNRMEKLKNENERVYSYIICTKPIDYIYQSIISEEKGLKISADILTMSWLLSFCGRFKTKLEADQQKIKSLEGFVPKYSLLDLKVLPWSVIFQR